MTTATVFKIWTVIAGLYGLFVLSQAKSPVHEIEAGIAFVIATISLGVACLLEAMNDTEARLTTVVYKLDALISLGEKKKED